MEKILRGRVSAKRFSSKNVTQNRKIPGRCLITNVTEAKKGHDHGEAINGSLFKQSVQALQDSR